MSQTETAALLKRKSKVMDGDANFLFKRIRGAFIFFCETLRVHTVTGCPKFQVQKPKSKTSYCHEMSNLCNNSCGTYIISNT